MTRLHSPIRVGPGLSLVGKQVRTTEEMIDVYHQEFSRHGYSAETLFYSEEKLHIAKLTHYGTLLSRLWEDPPSVLDVGCGYGSLVPFLPPCSYTGIDVVPEFLEEARRRYPSVRFELRNLLEHDERADWVLLVGIMGSVPEPEDLLTKAWKLADVAMVVDFIDADRYRGALNRYDTGACLKFLMGLGANRLEVLAARGFTWVVMVAYKEGQWLLDRQGIQPNPQA